MFERYTEKARRVLFFARQEALGYGSQVISPEHILLGLMSADETIPARYFPFRKSSAVEDVRREIEKKIVRQEPLPQSAELHLTVEARQILAYADEESCQLKNRHIETEHLFLGLLREEGSTAAEVLRQHGLRLPSMRETVAGEIGFPDII